MTSSPKLPAPIDGLVGVTAYRRRTLPAHVDLRLDGNEGALCDRALLRDAAHLDPEFLRTYPSSERLEAALAAELSIDPARVLVTAGGDEALDRVFRAYAGPGRSVILPEPSFEMLPRYAALVGCEVRSIDWPEGDFPGSACLAAADAHTALAFVVTPNNPTGAVATANDLAAMARGLPQAIVVLDHAYMEYGDDDLTSRALELPNAVVVRTFSKAWGLAGLRVGWIAGPRAVIDVLRAAASPFSVASVSIALAERALARGTSLIAAHVERIRSERTLLADALRRAGFHTPASQANFVLARGKNAQSLADRLLAAGIAIRNFAGRPRLEDAVRITCPGESHAFERLLAAIDGRPAPNGPGGRDARAQPARTAHVVRRTRETTIECTLALDGRGEAQIRTGIGMLDHLLESLTKHSGFDLTLRCSGDLIVDDHHSVEDCALALGTALDRALGDRAGIERFGHALVPLDEALARSVVDLSARPWPAVALGLKRPTLGTIATENLTHFLQSLATAARMALHVELLSGENDHHRAEAAFKATARALRMATARTSSDSVPSTKGVL
ncbi:MAG: imidazoleglycerol-phosphate dehydratase HisB [Planctomycetota bacterium]